MFAFQSTATSVIGAAALNENSFGSVFDVAPKLLSTKFTPLQAAGIFDITTFPSLKFASSSDTLTALAEGLGVAAGFLNVPLEFLSVK